LTINLIDTNCSMHSVLRLNVVVPECCS